MAILNGCEEKYITPVPEDRTCPVCGEEVEVFTKAGRLVEDAVCPKCGHVFRAEEQLNIKEAGKPRAKKQ